jgi:hypothetical protein
MWGLLIAQYAFHNNTEARGTTYQPGEGTLHLFKSAAENIAAQQRIDCHTEHDTPCVVSKPGRHQYSASGLVQNLPNNLTL